MKILNIFVCILYCFIVNAQPNIEFAKYKELCPNADVVSTNYNVQIDVLLQNSKPLIKFKVHEEFLYLTNNINNYTEREIPSSDFLQLKSHEAYVLVPNEKRYKRINVEKFVKSSLSEGDIFHDDSEILRFTLLQISKGTKSVINTDYEIPDPHMVPFFIISPYISYYNTTFTLNIDEKIEIKIDTFNLGKVNLNYSRSQSGKIITHKWDINKTETLKYEDSGPSSNYLAPQIIFRIRNYQVNNEKIDVLDDIEDLHKWYSEFLTSCDESIDLFRQISDSIVGNCSSDFEKANLIYNWVQKNIRYIAFEAGYASVIPEKASLVYASRFGDCKGMSNLLYKLLVSQNLNAYICWVGTRILPYKYTDTPSTVVDNHMIVAIRLNDTLMYLDPTHSNLSFGMPSPFIQGKEILINIRTGLQYQIGEVPILNSVKNHQRDSCTIILQGRDVIGEGFTEMTGYLRMDFMDNVNLTDYKSLLNYCRRHLIKGNNNFIIDTVWLENVEDKNVPLYINYKFKIPNYVVSINNEYFINLNLDKVFTYEQIPNTRNVPLSYRYNFSTSNVVMLKLNNGLKVSSLPVNEEFNTGNFSFQRKYLAFGDYLLLFKTYEQNSIMISPNQFDEYNTIHEKIQKGNHYLVILK
jgi:hypothetical protein